MQSNPVNTPLVPQFDQHLITVNSSTFCVGMTMVIISIIFSFILFILRSPLIPLVIIDFIFYIVTVIYCSFTYALDVWIDKTNRVISIRKRGILNRITYFCPKKYNIDDIKEFSLDVNKNGESRKRMICVIFNNGKEKEIIFTKRSCDCCTFGYDSTIPDAIRILNSLLCACEKNQQSLLVNTC